MESVELERLRQALWSDWPARHLPAMPVLHVKLTQQGCSINYMVSNRASLSYGRRVASAQARRAGLAVFPLRW